jgi:hypothetical protein
VALSLPRDELPATSHLGLPPATRSFVISPLSPCHRAHVSPVGVGIYPTQYFHTITMAAVSSSQ